MGWVRFLVGLQDGAWLNSLPVYDWVRDLLQRLQPRLGVAKQVEELMRQESTGIGYDVDGNVHFFLLLLLLYYAFFPLLLLLLLLLLLFPLFVLLLDGSDGLLEGLSFFLLAF